MRKNIPEIKWRLYKIESRFLNPWFHYSIKNQSTRKLCSERHTSFRTATGGVWGVLQHLLEFQKVRFDIKIFLRSDPEQAFP